jgi:hypothetical protein
MKNSPPKGSAQSAPASAEDARSLLKRNLAHAFTLPEGGSFKSLLSAIDEADQKRGR